ncbi:hypothetical protein CXF72_14055 [Psychromonas sp. MB-3u-54]|nr:hypothetical protein CXF72_14055 [Psychromonas sp. MB-3u-54]
MIKKALPIFNIKADFEIFEETVPVLIEIKLMGKSNKRPQHTTSNEVKRLKGGTINRPFFSWIF